MRMSVFLCSDNYQRCFEKMKKKTKCRYKGLSLYFDASSDHFVKILLNQIIGIIHLILGKPKMFIFQACRGEDIQQIHKNEAFHRMVHHDSGSLLHQLPREADIMKIYATTPGKYTSTL